MSRMQFDYFQAVLMCGILICVISISTYIYSKLEPILLILFFCLKIYRYIPWQFNI